MIFGIKVLGPHQYNVLLVGHLKKKVQTAVQFINKIIFFVIKMFRQYRNEEVERLFPLLRLQQCLKGKYLLLKIETGTCRNT